MAITLLASAILPKTNIQITEYWEDDYYDEDYTLDELYNGIMNKNRQYDRIVEHLKLNQKNIDIEGIKTLITIFYTNNPCIFKNLIV